MSKRHWLKQKVKRMKKKAQRTRNKNPCAGCQWGYVLNEERSIA